jgi:anti-anti-sigma factor
MKPNITHQIDVSTQTLCVTVAGDILRTNADEVRSGFWGLLNSPDVQKIAWQLLKLDLIAVRKIDSIGLNVIIAIIREIQCRNSKLPVIVSGSGIYRTFVFMGLDRQMDLKKVE